MRGLAAGLVVVLGLGVASGQEDVGMPAGTQKATAQLKLPASKVAPNVVLSAREKALQILNRFAYGPRPGDVDKVLAMGSDAWFAQQLSPEGVKDGAWDARVKDYPTLGMTAEQLLMQFPTDGYVKQVAGGQRAYPADAMLDSLYEVQIYRYQQSVVDKDHPAAVPTDDEKAAKKKAQQVVGARVAGELVVLPKGERMAAVMKLPVEDRIAFAENIPGGLRGQLLADFGPKEREVVLAMGGGLNVAFRAGDELGQAKVVRSIVTERQVQEVMTDFWFNHFNVYQPKDSDQWYTTGYERDVIRPHALGKFRDLLLGTAMSPAMMVYLDNWLSVGPDSVANNAGGKRGGKGLNENYGREVMELHTVGVNGGYTQADVTSLAAMLTGWGVDDPGHGGGFRFDVRRHEPGTKSWFGYTIDDDGKVLGGQALTADEMQAIAAAKVPDGMKQGYTALVLLAGSAKTARFVSYLLAQRFLADEPPAGLVDKLAGVYLANDGDIRAVLKALVGSAEFNSHRYFRNKVKTPFEFLVSAFRVTGTDPQNAGALVQVLATQFGEPLYRALPPTGYYITADHWMNTQSLLQRLNFADALTHGKVGGQKFDSSRVLALSLMNDCGVRPVVYEQGSDVALRALEGTLIGEELSPTTDRFVHQQMTAQGSGNPADTLNLLTALLLGSPEFQVR